MRIIKFDLWILIKCEIHLHKNVLYELRDHISSLIHTYFYYIIFDCHHTNIKNVIKEYIVLSWILNHFQNLNFLKNYLSKTKLLYLNKKLEIIANLIGKSYKLNILFCIFIIITFDCFIIHMVYTILSNLEVFCSNYLENLK